MPADLLQDDADRVPVVIPYELEGRQEGSSSSGAPESSPPTRSSAGFTAAVRTSCARRSRALLVLLESVELPGDRLRTCSARRAGRSPDRRADRRHPLPQRARDRAGGGGARVDAGGAAASESRPSRRAGGARGHPSRVEAEPRLELPLRPRMLRVIAANLAENAIRYAGAGATFALDTHGARGGVVLRRPPTTAPASPTRSYPAVRALLPRRPGALVARHRLGLAIVKHVVISAGGAVDASRSPEGGLTVTCRFPARV